MSRYIDADALRLDVFNHANRQYCEGNDDKEEAFICCLYLIDCMPIADVVEVVHGEWKPKIPLSKSYRFVCSVCGGTAYYCSGSCASVRNNVKNVCRYNYCPNCGADMRGERKILPKD